jgi:hypothetical protein
MPLRTLMKMAAMLMLLLLMAAEGRAQSDVGDFNPGANGTIYTLAVQADGKILVGGTFTTLGGGGIGTSTRNRIGTLAGAGHRGVMSGSAVDNPPSGFRLAGSNLRKNPGTSRSSFRRR